MTNQFTKKLLQEKFKELGELEAGYQAYLKLESEIDVILNALSTPEGVEEVVTEEPQAETQVDPSTRYLSLYSEARDIETNEIVKCSSTDAVNALLGRNLKASELEYLVTSGDVITNPVTSRTYQIRYAERMKRTDSRKRCGVNGDSKVILRDPDRQLKITCVSMMDALDFLGVQAKYQHTRKIYDWRVTAEIVNVERGRQKGHRFIVKHVEGFDPKF